jgi:hypothetical protein
MEVDIAQPDVDLVAGPCQQLGNESTAQPGGGVDPALVLGVQGVDQCRVRVDDDQSSGLAVPIA